MAPCPLLAPPASCEEEGTATSGFSLLCIFFLSPKMGSGTGLGSLLHSPGWGTKTQVPQAGSDAASSHAEGQAPVPTSYHVFPSQQTRQSKNKRYRPLWLHAQRGLQDRRSPEGPQSHFVIQAGAFQAKSPWEHPPVATRHQTWDAKGPQLPNILEKLIPIPLGSCSASLSLADTGHLLGARHNPWSPQLGGTREVTGGGACLSLPLYRRHMLHHGTNPTLTCSPRLKQPT